MADQVFISYAHADDQSLDEDVKGWVTNFIVRLEKAIGMKSGGSQVKCWKDHRLEPQRSVDDELHRRIVESKCIIAFMSPRYLESPWCRQEMDTFVELVGGGTADNRIFLVELLPTERSQWHPGIHNISEIRLWDDDSGLAEPMTLGWPVPNAKADKSYWREINNLSAILARQIQLLPAQTVTPTPQPVQPTVTVTPAPQPSGPLTLVINADKVDRALGKQIQMLLGDLDVETILAAEPLPDQLPAEYRNQLNSQLEDTDGVLIVYGSAPPSWVQAQHAQARRVLAMQRRGIWGALLDCPPELKPEHGLYSRSMMMLDCRKGISAEQLLPFIQKLQGASHV